MGRPGNTYMHHMHNVRWMWGGWHPTTCTSTCAINLGASFLPVKWILWTCGVLPSDGRPGNTYHVNAALLLPWIILNTNRKNKNRGGLGTRLSQHIPVWSNYLQLYDDNPSKNRTESYSNNRWWNKIKSIIPGKCIYMYSSVVFWGVRETKISRTEIPMAELYGSIWKSHFRKIKYHFRKKGITSANRENLPR